MGAGAFKKKDAERLQEALESDIDSVVELLSGAEGGLGRDVVQAVTTEPEVEAVDLRGGFLGFLEGLSGREQQLERQAGVLEKVVSSLSTASAEPGATS